MYFTISKAIFARATRFIANAASASTTSNGFVIFIEAEEDCTVTLSCTNQEFAAKAVIKAQEVDIPGSCAMNADELSSYIAGLATTKDIDVSSVTDKVHISTMEPDTYTEFDAWDIRLLVKAQTESKLPYTELDLGFFTAVQLAAKIASKDPGDLSAIHIEGSTIVSTDSYIGFVSNLRQDHPKFSMSKEVAQMLPDFNMFGNGNLGLSIYNGKAYFQIGNFSLVANLTTGVKLSISDIENLFPSAPDGTASQITIRRNELRAAIKQFKGYCSNDMAHFIIEPGGSIKFIDPDVGVVTFKLEDYEFRQFVEPIGFNFGTIVKIIALMKDDDFIDIFYESNDKFVSFEGQSFKIGVFQLATI